PALIRVALLVSRIVRMLPRRILLLRMLLLRVLLLRILLLRVFLRRILLRRILLRVSDDTTRKKKTETNEGANNESPHRFPPATTDAVRTRRGSLRTIKDSQRFPMRERALRSRCYN